MEKHIKNYCVYFGITPDEWVICECGCGQRAEQWHHLVPRSMFGSKRKKEQDHASNVIYINHVCHERAHKERAFNDELKIIHRKNLLKNSNNSSETKRYL